MNSGRQKTARKGHSDQKVRIIAGQWRGRQLKFPEANGLRPTGNRIRETLFNWLAPELPDSRCLDLFAGSGALGFEALSRGATHCYFIESSKPVAAALQSNAQALDAEHAHIYFGSALEYLQQPAIHTLDIVFLDPPFAHQYWQPCSQALCDHGWLKKGSLIYVEYPLGQHPCMPTSWRLYRHKRAGQVEYALYLQE